MRLLLLAKNKHFTLEAIQVALDAGWEMEAVVVPAPGRFDHERAGRIRTAAEAAGIPVWDVDDLHGRLKAGRIGPVDLVVSLLFWRRMGQDLISLPSLACVNLHPAPLPDYRGLGGYNFAILEQRPEWAVTVHHVAPEIDRGDIIFERRFPVDTQRWTALRLEQESGRHIVACFERLLDMAARGPLPRHPQPEGGRYIRRTEMEAARMVGDEDAQAVDRRARAFWFPPYEGAVVERGGARWTVVPRCILEELAERLDREVP